MADTHVVGCNWIELPKGKYKLRGSEGTNPPDFDVKSRCQIEVDVSWEEFISHEPEGQWADMAPFRI